MLCSFLPFELSNPLSSPMPTRSTTPRHLHARSPDLSRKRWFRTLRTRLMRAIPFPLELRVKASRARSRRLRFSSQPRTKRRMRRLRAASLQARASRSSRLKTKQATKSPKVLTRGPHQRVPALLGVAAAVDAPRAVQRPLAVAERRRPHRLLLRRVRWRRRSLYRR